MCTNIYRVGYIIIHMYNIQYMICGWVHVQARRQGGAHAPPLLYDNV